MTLFLIDDSRDYLDTIISKANLDEKPKIKLHKPEEYSDITKVIRKIKLQLAEGDIIFINCELLIPTKKRLDFIGIEILKLLRIRDVNNYCILYSFLSITQLVKLNPLNSIILSKGSSYLQLPFDESDLLEHINKPEISVKDNLLPFFRSEVDIQKIRHELANQWGSIRLSELLNIETIQTVNYEIELLKYLTPIEKRAPFEKKELDIIINNFDPTGKRIFYYDDMTEIWESSLRKLFGSANIKSFNPKNISKEELFDKIRQVQPGCLLLDLRLENEKESKNVLEYSGGKLLIELKQKFHSLPVIMFTASNKAESVRQLMAAGADYVWTKEGVDDGIDNVFTLNNTINLIKEVSRCVSKFKNKYYEDIYTIESDLSKINSFDNALLHLLSNNEILRNVKNIIIDTNYFIDSIEENYLCLFYSLLLTIKQYNTNFDNNLKVVIHSDVLWEIFRISKKDEYYVNPDPDEDRNNPYRVPVCRFLTQKLNEWRYQNLFYEDYKFGVEDLMREGSSLKVPTFSTLEYLPVPIEKKKNILNHVIKYFRKNDHDFELIYKNMIDEANTNIQKLNEDLNPIRDLVNLKLDADSTFATIIPIAFKQGNVIFISNDKGCSHRVGRIFDTNEFVDKIRIPYINNGTILTRASRITNPVVGNRITYNRFKNDEFNKLLLGNQLIKTKK